ncbi:serine/threonine-protein kinase [Stieleria varia]|uniref:non-specific serine/threonine protein kinase n=1 Tax=Stieleria varia TaxID=2528005 RepID=A0A5C5ZY93_9BACT|nr:serine/threonine-protein kinase [Stieleria varia]TWT91965.1 Serine/threonine-protein kinase PrkC [Stieleria varia]
MNEQAADLEPIDEDARRRFESQWCGGGPESLKQYVPHWDQSRGRATLAELVLIDLEYRWKDWANATNKSDPPSLEPYLRQYKVLREHDCMRCLRDQQSQMAKQYGVDLSLVASKDSDPASTETLLDDETRTNPSSSDESLPVRWGNYLLLERLGQGAMGVVYRARQTAADREVALKRVQPGMLTADLRNQLHSRFEVEANAAARLSSDYIVPVYDVGNVDGVPYYTMPLLTDGSLSDLVRENPLTPQRAARLTQQVALGIATAHAAELWHRDIKPGNILWDATRDRAMVADFGLVRMEFTESEMTHTGQLVGTPAYMPPEQARDARSVDARSDIYAIGATLYHLLTGRPPFQASSIVELMRQVLFDQPLSVRRLNPSVPRDLDTVCAHCLQKSPERRYASADELAQDLERFLTGRPILAQPIGLLERSWRWIKRNPVLSAWATTAALSAFITMGVITYAYLESRSQQARYEAMYQEARGAIDSFYTDFSDDPLFNQPGMLPTRRKYLSQALRYYQRLLAQRESDGLSVLDVADTRTRIGTLLGELGDSADAIRMLRQAEQDLRRFTPAEKNSSSGLSIQGDLFNSLGRNLLAAGNNQEALEAFQQAEDFRQRVVDQEKVAGVHKNDWESNDWESNDWEARRSLANAIMNVGTALRVLGRMADATQQQTRAQNLRTELLKDFPNVFEIRRDWAKGEFNLGVLLSRQNQTAGGRHLQVALETFEQLIAQRPSDLDLRQTQIECLRQQAWQVTSSVADENSAADLPAVLIKAQELAEKLCTEHPETTAFVVLFAEVNATAIQLHLDAERYQDADELIDRTESQLNDHSQNETPVVWTLSNLAFLRAQLHLLRGENDAAMRALVRSEQHLSEFLKRSPNDPAAIDRQALLDETIDQLKSFVDPV